MTMRLVSNPNDMDEMGRSLTINPLHSISKHTPSITGLPGAIEPSPMSTIHTRSSSTPITPAHVTLELAPNEELHIREPRKKIAFPSLFVWPALWHWIVGGLIALFLILACTVWADSLHDKGISTEQLLLFASIPIVSIPFTYCHIWLALWMTFYPIKFFGIWQIPGTNTGLGWQGIIPFKAEKMARMSVRLMTQQLLDVKEVFARLDPDRVAVEMGNVLKEQLNNVIDGVARKYHPDVWQVLPQRVKDEIVNKAHEDAPAVIAELMRTIKENIETVFDIEHMVVTNLMKDVSLLNDIFIRCGYQELVFIRNSGAYMGGIFGFIQMLIWIPLHKVDIPLIWYLPTYGFLLGLLTNWLALKMIFRPIEPKRVCGILCHGLFLRRQAEVSAEYGRTIAADVLNSKNIITALVTGPTTDKLFALVHQVIKKAIDEFAGLDQPLVKASMNVTLGSEKYDQIKSDIGDKMVEILPTTLHQLEHYTDRALDMENTLREKMSELSYEKFEGLLHPVFEEDEWKLVLMGGVLGIVIGFAQHFAGI